jgi:PAS domain S-box-containing protein
MAKRARAVSRARTSPSAATARLRDLDPAAAASLWAVVLSDPQHFFAATFEQTPEGIVICDAQGRFIFANRAARQLADAEVLGTEVREGTAVWGRWLDHKGQPLPLEKWPIIRALRGEVVPGEEVCKLQADGSRTCIMLAAAPVRDANGAIVGAVATSSDVTERRRSEEQLRLVNAELEQCLRAHATALEEAEQELHREARERRKAAESLGRSRRMLQEILDRSTAVIYVKDTAGRYLLINSHYERLFGVSNDQIVGKTDYDVFPAEIVGPLRANDERVMATGESLHFEEVVPQDGGYHTYVSVKFPLRDERGAIYAVCGISTDITERRAMEEELRRSRATLSAVIESSTDAIFSVDREYRLVACNTVLARLFQSLFGVPPRIGANLRDDLPGELADHWYALLDRALAGERLTVEELMPVEGAVRSFLVCLNPTLTDGRVSGVTAFAKDITELRHAEEQAAQHQADLAHVLRLQTMGEVAASLAHEINQPLGAIANYAQGCKLRLDNGTISAAELAQTIDEIAREALRAGEITRRVRELVHKSDPQRTPSNLNQIVASALEIVAPAARQRAITVRFRQGSFLPPVEVDRIQIEQVVVNLVLNGFDAVEVEGKREVQLRTAAVRDGVEVEVRDGGPGLDPALVEKVFEPFFTTKPSGLGMGLAISRSIVEAHGGRLWAAPHPDGGTIFRFTLPLAPEGDAGE